MPTLLRSPQTFLNEPIRVLDSTHMREYYTDYGDEELLQVRNYWRSYANRRELIDFGTRRTQVRYFYDVDTLTYYRQLGQGRRTVVPYHSIKLDIMRFSNRICHAQRDLAQSLINEHTDVQEWYDDTTRLMKYSYRVVTDVAMGSSGILNDLQEREYLRVIEEETSKFNLYARQVANGSVPIDGRLLNAACSLGRRLNRIFENLRLWQAQRNGNTQARRRLSAAEHCRDSEQRYGCIRLARMGWRPIYDITPIGDATCWDGCLCEMEYR